MTEQGEATGYIASLPEHWRDNSLYGALDAVGRFNLCSAYDISRMADVQAAIAFETRPPPRASRLVQIMIWARDAVLDANDAGNDFLHRVVRRVQQDVRDVPMEWLRHTLHWCPQCARNGIHRIQHQHRALWHCPVHLVRLQQFCPYCGAGRRYRVTVRAELFQCGCGYRLDRSDEDPSRLRFPWRPRSALHLANLVERVWIPELPARGDPLSPVALAPQDLRTHYAEMTQYAMPRWQWVDRSPLSRVLGRYFRFVPMDMSSNVPTRHGEGVRRVVQRARVLAMMAGHRCVEGPLDRIWQDDYPCPCAVGYQLWLQRVESDYFETTGPDVGLDPERYEGSHLGLCISAAWFASVQSRMLGEPSVYRTLLAFLEAPTAPPFRVQGAGDAPAPILALLSNTFQWFAVRCPGPAQAVIRTRARLDGLGRASPSHAGGPDAAVRDANWIMRNL